ncbi:MAG: hypothetical protein BGO43_08640 [Gammaproteobacteria bacterium 39-13]|nr:hypothetical protein [Gammaproteobacteria bacterium]OJV94311.1 MAG: hypothetical protein BGO43_08640 [Gammaproteobacteria bacterium 39-13]
MASKKKLSDPPNEHGLGYFFRRLFARKNTLQERVKALENEIHLEPKDWPEVQDFINRLNKLIETNTIVDYNIQRLNQRIVDAVENQINEKGQLQDIEQRFNALDIIADRFLSNALNKIVGLRSHQNDNTEFSQVVAHFKDRLHQRYKEELALKQKMPPLRPH